MREEREKAYKRYVRATSEAEKATGRSKNSKEAGKREALEKLKIWDDELKRRENK